MWENCEHELCLFSSAVRNERSRALLVLTVIHIPWAVLHSWCSGMHHLFAFFFLFFPVHLLWSCYGQDSGLQGSLWPTLAAVILGDETDGWAWGISPSLSVTTRFSEHLHKMPAVDFQILLRMHGVKSSFSGKCPNLELLWIGHPERSQLKVLRSAEHLLGHLRKLTWAQVGVRAAG